MIINEPTYGFCLSQDDIDLLRKASAHCHPTVRGCLEYALNNQSIQGTDGHIDLEMSCIAWMRLSEGMIKNAMTHDHHGEATAQFHLARHFYAFAHGRFLHANGVSA